MPDTQQYEDAILPLPNVTGVEYNEEDGVVIAFVKEKVPEEELAPDELVANSVGPETDVIETGEFHALRSEGHTDSQHRGRYRPIEAGVSEGQVVRNMAGTGGPLARVQAPDSSNWAVEAERGDLVRISNCHVLAAARARPGLFGDGISQPGKLDAGNAETVGKLAGYVPIIDEVQVDCAARTIHDEDRPTIRGFDDNCPRSIRREYSDLRGQTLAKSGRTTAISSAEVIASTASVRVNMGDRTVLFRNQILTGDMSRPGDSGSPVLDTSGALTGLLFAGSDTTTVVNQIALVEDVFGVEMLTADDPAFVPEDPEPGPDPEPPEEPEEPEPSPPSEQTPIQTLQVGPASLFETTEYSFAVSGDVSFSGRSTSQVGDRVNGWVNRWSNSYQIRGHITDQAIPEGTRLRLNGESIRPDELVERSKSVANVPE